jgi:hypothetical protein
MRSRKSGHRSLAICPGRFVPWCPVILRATQQSLAAQSANRKRNLPISVLLSNPYFGKKQMPITV